MKVENCSQDFLPGNPPDRDRSPESDAPSDPGATPFEPSIAQTPHGRPALLPRDIVPGVSCAEAALVLHAAGFRVIPIDAGTKVTAVKWDGWLDQLSPTTIASYWAAHPGHELGCIVDDRLLVLDTDSPTSSSAVVELERAHGVESNFVVGTRRGEHRYYRLAEGTFARTNVHSTESHPERIDVKARRSMVVMPPSANKTIVRCDIDVVADLTIVGQDFVDAVFRHNGAEPPREIANVEPRPKAPTAADEDKTLARLRVMLDSFDPDCGYDKWYRILMAVHHATGGSDDGLALADGWSARGRTYCGEQELRSKWRTFEGYSGTPVTEGTLRAMLKKQGADLVEIADAAEPQFERFDGPTVDNANPPITASTAQSVSTAPVEATPDPVLSPTLILTAFSITRSLKKLKREMVEQKHLLDGIALMGQATVLYAAPNTGKTLLVLWMLIQAIKQNRVDPSLVFYINCDDSMSGLVQKGEIAAAHGFSMLSDGYEGFEIKNLKSILLEVIRLGQAMGAVIVLDTLKKFTDLMDKTTCSDFMKLIRRFVMRGGTVLMLAHANKRLGPDKKPVYAGTSDILDDADGGYIMWVSSEAGAAERVVEFERRKGRGNVRQRATFAYSGADGLPYERILASVREVGAAEAVEVQVAAEVRADAVLVEATKGCIREGIVKRMELMPAIALRTKCGRRNAEQLLDKYTGTDPRQHHWNYTVQARGAKVYHLLVPDPPADGGIAASTSTPREHGHE